MQWCPGTGSRVKQQSGSLNCDLLTHDGVDGAQDIVCLVFLICFLTLSLPVYTLSPFLESLSGSVSGSSVPVVLCRKNEVVGKWRCGTLLSWISCDSQA